MKKYLLLLVLILIFSVSFIIGDAQNPKYWVNTWTEVEELGNGKFGATIHTGHRVFKDKADGQYKKHKLTDERPTKDYVLIQSAKCCVEIYPYYVKYFDVNHEQVRLHEERWVVQRWRDPPGKWQDIGAWNPIIATEETDSGITVTINYTTDYGPLTVKYIQRDGITLKHDVIFINASGPTETFRVVQAWAGIVGDKCNGRNLPVIEDATFLAFHDSDKPQKKFNISENLHSMIFNPDGSEKTDQCLQRPISIETHAQGMKADFIYGNWVLAQDESLEIDPDTATLDDPTEDGFIYWYTPNYIRDNTDTELTVALYMFSPPDEQRGYVEWDIESIPDGMVITNTVFKYHGKFNGGDCHIHEMVDCQPSEQPDNNTGNQAIYDEANEGTIYADPDGFPVVATNQEVDLGTDADSDLQSQLGDNWFAIGIAPDGPSEYGSDIYSEEYASTPDPTLYVEYEEPPPVNVIFFSTPY